MNLFSKFNKSFESPFTHAPADNAPFINLDALDASATYQLTSLWVNTKSKFGSHPVAGTTTSEGDVWVSLPSHLLDVANTILTEEECIQAINDGNCIFKVVSYHSKKYNRDCYSIEFVD